jgi:hypothetical protein
MIHGSNNARLNKKIKRRNIMKQFFGKIMLGFVFVALLGAASTIGVAAAGAAFKGSANAEITAVAPGPNGVLMTAVAEGNATHLGNFTRVEHLLLNPDTGAFTGDVVFTAADGSQLTALMSGSFTSASTALGSYVFTGGTGRFADTTGSANFSAALSDPVHFTVEFDGNFD